MPREYGKEIVVLSDKADAIFNDSIGKAFNSFSFVREIQAQAKSTRGTSGKNLGKFSQSHVTITSIRGNMASTDTYLG